MRYEFDRDDAYRFKNEVGGFAKEKNHELIFAFCPYCNGGKHRDKDTFSINLNTGQFECKRLSCGAKGNMITLSRDFNFSLGTDYDAYFGSGKQYRTFKKTEIKMKEPAVRYLQDRGISELTTSIYKVTTAKGKDNILVFPFYDEKNNLTFIKYRKTDFNKGRDKSKEWCESDCKPILFGMNQCTDSKRLVLTEGQIDSLSVAEAGIENAVSVPIGCNGFTWVPHCWDFLGRFDELIVFGDLENEKISLLEEMRKRFQGIVKAVQIDDYRNCKDANELLKEHGKEAVRQAVENARIIPDKQIIELADVEAVDIYSMENLKTNISDIDNLLGGLYFGQLILLTGQRGDGKSTLMSQIIVEALDQDYNTFIYSGELRDFYFKRWIDMQIAGTSVITQLVNGRESHYISNQTIEQINNWYRGSAFLYDNNCIDDEEMADLLATIEKAIMQYGCRVICIDNLMTALDVGMRDDLYRAQSKFVGKLAKIAKIHNVLIILVAHPRKTSMSLTNDDVSGSADITNKVDVVMQYVRPEEKNGVMVDESLRLFRVSKNRLTGKLTKKDHEIELYYSERSKRIVGKEKDFSRVYGFAKELDGFTKILDDEALPFD